METNICGKTAGAKYNFVNFLAHRPKSDLLKFGNKVMNRMLAPPSTPPLFPRFNLSSKIHSLAVKAKSSSRPKK